MKSPSAVVFSATVLSIGDEMVSNGTTTRAKRRGSMLPGTSGEPAGVKP